MSTKSTVMCSHDDNWHLFFDYADMNTHLFSMGKEIVLPLSFKEMIRTAIEMHQMKEIYGRDEKKFFNRKWVQEKGVLKKQ